MISSDRFEFAGVEKRPDPAVVEGPQAQGGALDQVVYRLSGTVGDMSLVRH